MEWQFEIWQVTATHWNWKLRRPDGSVICFGGELASSFEDAEKEIAELGVVALRTKKIVDIDSKAEVKKRGGSRPALKKTPSKKLKKKK